MIIQCKQCRTKFRFDDAQMEGDGLWVRCSCCQHVFFQDNPAKMSTVADLPQEDPFSPSKITPKRTASRLVFEPAKDMANRKAPDEDEDVANFLQDVMAPEETAGDDFKPKPRPVKKAGINLTDIEVSPEFKYPEAMEEFSELSDEKPAPPVRKKSRLWKVALWIVLVIIVIPAIVYFVFFPQLGERYITLGEYGVRVVLNAVGVSLPVKPQPVTGLVKLQNIQQKVINNYILGNIRIVEGTVVNQADFPVARILLKGQILDAYAVVLGERVTYAGNILTDEELTNLSEEEIFTKLSLPAGRDNSNERVIPNGRIPFMIVFTREPPGTIKTTVMIAGAERLL